jgi:PAS domain S-box-containing protein
MVLLNSSTRRNAEGQIIGVLGVGQDITELDVLRTGMEHKVAKRTSELNAIFTLSPDGFVLFDNTNNIVYVNPVLLEMTGFKLKNTMGINVEQFSSKISALFDLEKTTPTSFINDNDNDNDNDSYERTFYLARPSTRVIKCIQKSMRDDEGVLQGQVLYFRDVTHETEVDTMKSEFLTTAAHELRTPLASIYGFSELLMHRTYDATESKDMIETIHRQSLHLKKLLDELLDLSRIEARAGKDFYMKPSSLESVVNQCINDIKGAHKGRFINFINPDRWPLVNIDEEKLSQVFTNVLSNSLKYSPDGANVDVSTSSRIVDGHKEFGVHIQDYGIGLSNAERLRVGERFYRADGSGSIPGTGLGLALVKEIISIHEGELEIASESNIGSTFTVWLPIYNQENIT